MDTMIGRYEVLAEIGQGGMGTVYRVLDLEMERLVALKWLLPHLAGDPALVAGFKRQARLVARLEHPYVVPIYEVGEYLGRPFLVMRLLAGGTLRERVNEGALTLRQFLVALAQVAEALAGAHEQQLVHGDLKPGNILFDERGTAFVADFGAAALLAGTPAYSSPEQLAGLPVGPASDQYALAALALEVLSGRVPYDGDEAQIRQAQAARVGPNMAQLAEQVPGLPAGVISTLQRGLAGQPEGRYGSVTAFVTQLQEALSVPALLDVALPLVVAAAPLPDRVTPVNEMPDNSALVVEPTMVAALVGVSLPPETELEVEKDYQEGLAAMGRSDWVAAEAAFARVAGIDAHYRRVALLQQQVAKRLKVDQLPAVETPPPLPPGDAEPIAVGEQRSRPGWRWGLLLLLPLLVVVGVAGFARLGDGPVTTATPLAVVRAVGSPAVATRAATAVVLDTVTATRPAGVLVVAAGSRAGVRLPAESAFDALQDGDVLSPRAGMVWQSGQGVLALVLPEGTELFLAANSVVMLESLAGMADAVQTALLLQQGRLLVVPAVVAAGQPPLLVSGAPGVSVAVMGGPAGVDYVPLQQIFAVDCFDGRCLLTGNRGEVALGAGEFSQVGRDGRLMAVQATRPELYCTLSAYLGDCPTPTPTATVTTTGTPTLTPTATRATPSATPSSTALFTPTPSATLPPTAPPEDTDTPPPPPTATNVLPTNTPPKPTDTPTPPKPTETPTPGISPPSPTPGETSTPGVSPPTPTPAT